MSAGKAAIVIEDIPRVRSAIERELKRRTYRIYLLEGTDDFQRELPWPEMMNYGFVVVVSDLVDSEDTAGAGNLKEMIPELRDRAKDIAAMRRLLPPNHQVLVYSFGITRYRYTPDEKERELLEPIINELKQAGISDDDMIPKVGSDPSEEGVPVTMKWLLKRIEEHERAVLG